MSSSPSLTFHSCRPQCQPALNPPPSSQSPSRSPVTTLNDYRPVALTPITMKCFERVVLAHIQDTTLDPLHAYHTNRSTKDAISAHQHCTRPFPTSKKGARATTLHEHGQDPGDGLRHKEGEKAAPTSNDPGLQECVSSFKFLGLHICDNLTWMLNITQLVKKAHQWLYFLWRLRKFGMSQRTRRTFYTAIIEIPSRY
ncbi:hypothetical protein L3Q82_024042, partial [Scortum barcoo]